MANRIALKIAAANIRDSKKADEVGESLQRTFIDAEVYHLEPPKDRLVAAAIDWIIISQVADILGIASALWGIYDGIIRPLKRGKEDEQGLYVAIDPEHGLDWFLGKDFKHKDVFVKDFVARVTEYQHTDDAGHVFTKTVREIQAGEIWIKK